MAITMAFLDTARLEKPTVPQGKAIIRSGGLEDELTALGYAKVIVSLVPSTTGAALTTRSARIATNDLETSLAPHFIVPGHPAQAGLAAAPHRTPRRQTARGKNPRPVRIYPRLGLAVGYVDKAGLMGLRHDTHVRTVDRAPEVSLIKPGTARPAKLGGGISWGIKRLDAERLWASGYTGKGVVVGHLDTGVDGDHPALKDAIAAFAEFDLDADQVPGAPARDSDWHGTHTAGTIVGRSGAKGVFGIAPEAKLASAMVIEGGQVIDRVLAGMEWLLDQNVRIMNVSLGLQGYTPAFEAIVDALIAANVFPVIAIGNEGRNTSRSPGNYATVVSVGATDKTDSIWIGSGSQTFRRTEKPTVPDIVAPGVAVLSCMPNGTYAESDGTSMATPHVAGLAALLLQAKPNATAKELERAILGSCSLPLGMDANRGNRGIPNAVKAFSLLTGTELSMPVAPPTTATATAQPKADRRKKLGRRPDRSIIAKNTAKKTQDKRKSKGKR